MPNKEIFKLLLLGLQSPVEGYPHVRGSPYEGFHCIERAGRMKVSLIERLFFI